ncbi:MAG: SpoIID/LytB domain-containing protein, partial [Defluviitaleaceae bacterium]|nr:SpoIID/LytB domain-containing protein [Defluviitaleaceae bacterium]
MRVKKSLLGAIVFVLALIVPVNGLLASDFDGFLRIGLRQYFSQRSQINIYSQHMEVGVFSHGNFQNMGTLQSANNFTIRPSNAAFSQIGDVFATLEQAQLFSAYHPGSVPAFVGHGYWGHWTLYLPEGQGSEAVAPNNSRVTVYANGVPVLISDNTHQILQFRDVSGITDLGTRQYRGIIEVNRFGRDSVSAVNVVHMNEYLFSVVPSEMPASWEMEALKAQAVAARTFTLYRMASWAGQDYNLCDTVFSQVYSGVFREHYRTTEAVLQTADLVILHNGQPILAAYSSCAGGHTANSEDVWFAALP